MALLPSSGLKTEEEPSLDFYILYFIHIKDDGKSPTNKWFTIKQYSHQPMHY